MQRPAHGSQAAGRISQLHALRRPARPRQHQRVLPAACKRGARGHRRPIQDFPGRRRHRRRRALAVQARRDADEARFFIPILTPSYFTSEACREELEKFLRAEADRGRNDLVLPIYYIECDVMEDEDLRATDPWQARFTNASRRTGASFASSRLRPGMSGERWSGWHGRSSKPTGARSRASAAAAGRGRHETRVPPRRVRRVGRDTCRPSLALPGCGGGWARRRAPGCCPRCPRPSDVTEAPLARDPEDPVAGPWRARTILLVSLTCRPGPVVAVRSPSLRDAYCLN